MRADEALRAAIPRLRAAGIDGPERDARVLLAEALGVDRGRLILHLDQPMADAVQQAFMRMIDRRAARQPVAQIVGRRLFHDRWFRVTPDVLDPRPETEELVALALQEPFARLLDLGTGSGAIALSLLAERPDAQGVATDVSEAALAIAAENAQALGLSDRLTLSRSDWFASVTGEFDLIVSNPPYIAAAEMPSLDPEVRDHEPRLALTDDADGLSAYRAIAAGAAAHLTPGGRLLVEIGAGQGPAVSGLFTKAGLDGVAIHTDLGGKDRVVAARRSG